MPGEAAANGDYLLPTVFHSVQSDESRHISNGYSIILMALADERNRQLLERDLRYAWWNNHAVVDAAIGTFIEYGTKDRRKDRECYAEAWRRWIYDDYYRVLPRPAGEVRPDDPARPRRGGLEPDLEQGLRPRGRPVLRHRLVRQLLADRRDGRQGLRVVRVQVPGLVRQVRQVVGAATPTSSKKNGHKPIAFEAERRLRVPAPLLDLHGAVPDPRGHGRRRGRRPGPHVLLGDLPLDRRGRVPARVRGPADAVDGPAHRQARVGDAATTARTSPRSCRTSATSATTATR